MRQQSLWILAISAAMITPAMAQLSVYPANGQSPEQQQTDQAECYQWAVQQTGIDPAAPPPVAQAAAPPTTATGTTPGAGARGAARGAVAAEIVGGDAGKGAVAGATVNRSRSRRANAAAEGQMAQQQQAASQQQMDTFNNANAACLEGRGYSVK
jgi:hypothetical protein